MKDLASILSRVEVKKLDYARYDFSTHQDSALKTFFDLAQEYDGLKNLYLISVTVPHVFFGMLKRWRIHRSACQSATFAHQVAKRSIR